METRLAIFASGRGSNAEKIISYFQGRSDVQVTLIVSNKKDAKVLELARDHDIERFVITRSFFYDTRDFISELSHRNITHIVLAGFLWKIPDYLIAAYPEHIVNIHPALLPKYGGKGMYGHHVHRAVLENKESESGITIHLVNEIYDDGKVLFQKSTNISDCSNAEQVGAAVLKLEHLYFPQVIDQWVSGKIS